MTKPNTSISDDILAKGRREVTVFGPSHNTKTRVTVSKEMSCITLRLCFVPPYAQNILSTSFR